MPITMQGFHWLEIINMSVTLFCHGRSEWTYGSGSKGTIYSNCWYPLVICEDVSLHWRASTSVLDNSNWNCAFVGTSCCWLLPVELLKGFSLVILTPQTSMILTMPWLVSLLLKAVWYSINSVFLSLLLAQVQNRCMKQIKMAKFLRHKLYECTMCNLWNITKHTKFMKCTF